MIHALGETYGKLPSEVLRDGDTFDMLVFDVVSTLREEKDKKGKRDPSSYSVEELKAGIDKFRSK